MSYQKTDWENLPSTNTPLIASNLNNIESGIENNELNNTLLGIKVDNIIGADVYAYSSSSTYNVGDYCIYNNTLYRCKTIIKTAESFDSSKWEQVNIINQLSYKQSVFSNNLYNQWIRLASFSGPCMMQMYVSTGGGGYQTEAVFTLKSMSGYSESLNNIVSGSTNGGYLTKLRIVAKGNDTCYLEGYCNVSNSKNIYVKVNTNTISAGYINLYNTAIAGGIPSGYSASSEYSIT